MRPGVLLVLAAAASCGGGGGGGPARTPEAPTIANPPGPEPEPPVPSRCPDPIAGTWRARVFRAEVGKVDEVTLTLVRVGITELRGQIVVESWDASGRDDAPGACLDGSPAITRVVQTANGTVHGTEVDIVGSDPERTAFACGIETGGTYNPDHFTGALDEGSTLVTTNDDGGTDQGRPHVFERQACRAP